MPQIPSPYVRIIEWSDTAPNLYYDLQSDGKWAVGFWDAVEYQEPAQYHLDRLQESVKLNPERFSLWIGGKPVHGPVSPERELLLDIFENGLRCDMNPTRTSPGGEEFLLKYFQLQVDRLRRRARDVLYPSPPTEDPYPVGTLVRWRNDTRKMGVIVDGGCATPLDYVIQLVGKEVRDEAAHNEVEEVRVRGPLA